MKNDKYKFISFNEIKKQKKVTFGNNSPTTIKGKGTVLLKDKVKYGKFLFVDGLRHNFLSVIQMCYQGHEVVFRSNNCVVRNLDKGKIIIKGTRIPGDVYVLEGGQEQYYLRKLEEIWFWHKILGHICFTKLHKSSRMGVVCHLPNISLPENNICKSCQFSKKTKV